MKGDVYAIDARMIEESGIGTYIRMMLRTGKYSVALGSERKIRKYDSRIEVIPFEEKIYSIGEQLRYPYKRLKKSGVTVLHAPHYNAPLFWSRKLIVTIHDLIHLKFPQYLPNRLAYVYAWAMMKFDCVRADKIFTVSKFTKQDLQSTLHAKGDKIAIIYNTIEGCFKKREEVAVSYLRSKHGIPQNNKIVLYVGNIKPHKNVKNLVEAFQGIQKEDVSLILVGKSFHKTEEDRLLFKCCGDRKRIIMTGAVSKRELIDWYNLADVFVFPSLYEGFGIPPLEAMACGTPVVCSSSSSLPEIVEDAAVMVEPRDVDSIQRGIQSVLDMSDVDRNDLIEKGYKRVDAFSRKR